MPQHIGLPGRCGIIALQAASIVRRDWRPEYSIVFRRQLQRRHEPRSARVAELLVEPLRLAQLLDRAIDGANRLDTMSPEIV